MPRVEPRTTGDEHDGGHDGDGCREPRDARIVGPARPDEPERRLGGRDAEERSGDAHDEHLERGVAGEAQTRRSAGAQEHGLTAPGGGEDRPEPRERRHSGEGEQEHRERGDGAHGADAREQSIERRLEPAERAEPARAHLALIA
jgi:hypothetical protein